MAKSVTIPIKVVGGVQWADLSASAPTHTHLICGETFNQQKDLSFAGGHRVRVFAFKKSVHWRIPIGVDIDISDVPAADAPRKQPSQRHGRR